MNTPAHPTPPQASRLTVRLFTGLNVLFGLPVLSALVARWWLPYACVPCGVANVVLPWLFIVPTAFIVLWGVRRALWGVAANLLLLALHWPHPLALFQLHAQTESTPAAFTVMTANLDEFVYARAPQLPALAQFINSQKPDILCLQEVYYPLWHSDSTGPHTHKRLHNLAYLQQTCGYPHVAFTELVPGYGLAVFSKHPLVAYTLLPGATRTNGIQKVWFTVGGDTLLLYNMHLQSLQARRGSFVENSLAQPGQWGAMADSLAATWRIQQHQAELLAHDLARERFPSIIAGDLNAPPFGYVYKTACGKLNDAFYERGNGFGSTFGSGFTALRIDYIMTDGRLQVLGQQTVPNLLSNHCAVKATVEFVKK